MTSVKAYGAQSATSGLAPLTITRRTLRANDVAIEIDYCGVCHSDLHSVANDWGRAHYPLVPGHEIIGRVCAVGAEVKTFKPGDRVGVGCMVDACLTCSACQQGEEQYCLQHPVMTYNDLDNIDRTRTYGGYSNMIVVRQEFVIQLPANLNPATAAPILCAGITTYSPLKYLKVGKGHKVGVLGMGGLGHMAVKFAKAMGAEVTIFTRSEAKREEAKRQGADHVVISTDQNQMRGAREQFDFLLDTIPVEHDYNPYLRCLKYNGVHMVVGQFTELTPALDTGELLLKRRSLVGSFIGGIAETKECLEFCAEHGIECDVEMLNMADINYAYERLKKGDVKYRFVIDMATL